MGEREVGERQTMSLVLCGCLSLVLTDRRQTDREEGGGGGGGERIGRGENCERQADFRGWAGGGGILWSLTLSPDTLTQGMPMATETINKQTNTRKVSMAQTEGSGDVNNFSR